VAKALDDAAGTLHMDAEIAYVHDRDMDVAYVSALSALGGSVVGGLISGAATWLSQRTQVMAVTREHDRARREDLYREFVVAASKLYGDALTRNDPQIQEIVALYATISRMRVLSSPRIVASADSVMRTALDTFFRPNKTVRELHELLQKSDGTDLDLLRDFSEIAREELRTL
jgi:hypothetical protein